MALTASKEVVEQDGKILSVKKDAVAIFKGALVKTKANGLAAPAAGEAGSQFAGVAYEEKDASESEVRVITEGAFVLDGTGFAQSDVGSTVFAADDATVTLTEGTTSKQKVGTIVKYLSATQVLVKIAVNSGVGAAS